MKNLLEVKQTFLVEYHKSATKMATLYNCYDGSWFLNYIGVDGLGWSSYIKEIEEDEAKRLIF